MKKSLLTAVFFIAAISFSFGQTPEIGTPAWVAQHHEAERTGPAPTPQNGNNSLSVIYSNTACGLNYTMVTHRLGQRFFPVGAPQPTAYQVTLPPCAVVQQAFLYTEALGVASSITATIVDPASASTNYNMSLIGSSVDVCWGMNGTHVWRSDVTASITGSGTYTLSGFPTNVNANMSTVDVEGATLIVIYTDPTASYTGSLQMDDGCYTIQGGTLSHVMGGFTACANSTSATAFMLVGDMQMPGYYLNMNNAVIPQPQWDWWNEISYPTTVTNGQNACFYNIQHWSDCFTLAVSGLYFQTACSTCTPAASPVTLSTSSTPDFCNANGTATVAATGGSGNYTYLWSNGQTTATATALSGGTYTVWVSDGATCVSTQVVVAHTGMNITLTSTPVTCTASGTATATVTGGQAPYTYSWNSTPVQTTATATNLPSAYYTVTITDNGGCVTTSTVVVSMTQTLTAVATTVQDTCNNNTGAATVTAYYGVLPYSYLWSPGNQTTNAITGQAAGTYSCTITDSAGCTFTLPVTITPISSNPIVYTGTSGFVTCGDSLQLNATSNSPGTYSWSPSTSLNNPNIASPVCSSTVTITYTVTLTTACATATDVFTVYVDTLNVLNEQICFVTVDTTINKNVVIWERWNSPQNGNYNIYRESATPGVYTLIGTQPISQFSTYTDLASTPSSNADRYVITTVNSCGQESDTSNHHRTIYMTTTSNGPGWDLNWTAYEGLPISIYSIYRGPTMNSMVLIAQVPSSSLTYTDATPPPGIQYYMVEAVHPFGGCTPMRLSGPQSALAFSGALSNIVAADQTAVNENDLLAATLNVSPNPGNGNFQLSMSLAHAQQIQVIVYDNLGRNVYSKNENANAGMFNATMDLSSLSSGVYSVQVRTSNGFAAKRLVVE